MAQANATATTSAVKVHKPSIMVLAQDTSGNDKIKNVSFERVVDEAGIDQLTKNVKLVGSEAGNELFEKDFTDEALFIVKKAGKSFTPAVAYGAVAPWESKPTAIFYEGCEAVKSRYEVNMKRSFKAIDLITKDVEVSGKRTTSKSKVADEALKTMTPEEQQIVKTFMQIQSAMEKSKRASKAEKTVKQEIEQASEDLEGIVADL